MFTEMVVKVSGHDVVFTTNKFRSPEEHNKLFWVLGNEKENTHRVWPAQWCDINQGFMAGGNRWFELDEVLACAPMIVPEINLEDADRIFNN